MAQLDKTFPTNDCAMYYFDYLSEQEDHPMSRYFQARYSKSGFRGLKFKITLRQKQRFVDLAKCTACGDCKRFAC
jgi:heterodisulfide reductase subunit A-like polyferredoxin